MVFNFNFHSNLYDIWFKNYLAVLVAPHLQHKLRKAYRRLVNYMSNSTRVIVRN